MPKKPYNELMNRVPGDILDESIIEYWKNNCDGKILRVLESVESLIEQNKVNYGTMITSVDDAKVLYDKTIGEARTKFFKLYDTNVSELRDAIKNIRKSLETASTSGGTKRHNKKRGKNTRIKRKYK